MWCDNLPHGASWTVLWRHRTICPQCSAIWKIDLPCPVCGYTFHPSPPETIKLADGRHYEVPAAVFTGAEGRYEDYVYLQMMEREWKRPNSPSDIEISPDIAKLATRASIVILFWSYFETRIDRLLRSGMQNVPQKIAEDVLARYSGIGSRIDRLYRLVFGSTYNADLIELGYSGISQLLSQVQIRRNEFSHGNPQAIDDALVTLLVENLEQEHESWIAVFNKRIAVRTKQSISDQSR